MTSCIDEALAGRMIFCTGIGCNRYTLTKLTAEHTLKLLPCKKTIFVTNDKRNAGIDFHGIKPEILWLENRGSQINYANFLLSALSYVMRDPATKDDDILLFKCEDLFINDQPLFLKALDKVVSGGFDGVLKTHMKSDTTYGAAGTCYSYDAGLVKVCAIRELCCDLAPVEDLRLRPDSEPLVCEQYLTKKLFGKLKNIYQVPATTEQLAGFSELGFYHMATSTMYIDPSSGGWDKKDYHDFIKR